MNKSWKKGKLSSFVIDFVVPQRDKPKIFSGKIPWCRIEDFNGTYLFQSLSGQCVDEETVKAMGLKVYPINTVIVSCSADLGKCAIIGKPLVTNQTFIGLVPSKDLNSLFLYYYMSSIADTLNKMASGATIKYLSKKKFQDLDVCFPQLTEQKNIVAIIEKAFVGIDKAKANAEKNLQNAKALFESYLKEVFHNKEWKNKMLGEVCNIVGGGTPSKSNQKFYGGEILWATVRDMRDELIVETEHTITKQAVKNSSTNVIPKGNVIIATRVGLGKVCLLENDTAINQDLKGVIPFDLNKLSVKYLFYWLKSVSSHIINEGTGATVQGVKLPFIKSLLIPIPGLKEQQLVVKNLELLANESKRLEEIYQQKIEELEALKKAILGKAFSGELSHKPIPELV